jgi:hypothetical protein
MSVGRAQGLVECDRQFGGLLARRHASCAATLTPSIPGIRREKTCTVQALALTDGMHGAS